MRVCGTVCFVGAFAFGTIFGQEPKLGGDFAHRMAKIELEAEEAKDEVRAKLSKEMAAIDDNQLVELKKLMDEATQKADLDAAILVRDKMQALESKQPPNDELPTLNENDAKRRFVAKLLQCYWIPPIGETGYRPISPNGFVFRSDGLMVPIEMAKDLRLKPTHRWAPISDRNFVVLNDQGNICLFTLLPNGRLHRDLYGDHNQFNQYDFDAEFLPLSKKKK